MPTYSYRCQNCNHRWTTIRPVDERNDETDCPACEEAKSKRLFDAPHVGMIPGTYTKYQQELDKKAMERAQTKERQIARSHAAQHKAGLD